MTSSCGLPSATTLAFHILSPCAERSKIKVCGYVTKSLSSPHSNNFYGCFPLHLLQLLNWHYLRGHVSLLFRLVQSEVLFQHTRTARWWASSSLVPRPRPAFRRLHFGKARRAWYLFSIEHDVIENFPEQTGCVSRIVQLTTRSTLGVYDNCPPLTKYVQ